MNAAQLIVQELHDVPHSVTHIQGAIPVLRDGDIKDKQVTSATQLRAITENARNIDEVVKQARKAISYAEMLSRVTFEVTRDPALLQQYYNLREHVYRDDLGLKDFCGAEDQYDIDGEIVVARLGGEVVGGARINYSRPENPKLLVLEENQFKMQDLFPECHLVDKVYCEFSRLVIKKEHRYAGKLLGAFLRVMVIQAQNNDAEYLFTVSPLRQAALYRCIFHKMKLQYLLETIKVPAKKIYEGIPMVLSRMELTPIVEKSTYKELVVT